ncbi:MAG: DUF4835 family protein [Bacteroidales bacterium]|jgi:hypothetical protein|nr:DUF4835 family protein [Bacteroidales bacterium]
MKKYFCLTLLIIVICFSSQAQELRCRVNVQFTDIPDVNKDLFTNFKQTVEQFMNNTVWTDQTFTEQEKIEMVLNIKINKMNSTNNFNATFQVQASRPVFASSYTTTVFNYVDARMNFVFEENQRIEPTETSFLSNLSSTLSFFAYIVIGLDADTFAQNGGTAYFQKAQTIVNTTSSSGEASWSSKDSEGKYWLVEDMLNSSYSGFRRAMYTYHRLGLDVMSEKVDEGRKQIIKALSELETVYAIRPSALLLTVFFYAKKDEIIQIYSEAPPEEKQRVLALTKKLNPANAAEYDTSLQ